ncbi:DUF2723 domain-containing protein [Fulvivirgaceae bacterium PWU4]|uniref:DUF2723 domain-containing protein n=1 Tax=Chryseosolibacter histidini TaxID=2782349 RepID=A0AAP2DTI7_9BACT|nr:DUF2723 domain-containing protein [Chryseosolibacter histidini]MBT1700289.1 DUF2723 domain-containing protein [Chryseosolibacter histidini]
MINFQKYNNLSGWAVFVITLIVYWITMEPTASFWDCGEFIAASYKLQVPHPPGAPFFLLIGRLFSFLSFGDVTAVAYWINFSSVLAGAFTSMFLFWSITLLGRRLMKINTPEALTADQALVLVGAGLTGALAYTFADSAWFSAAEAEVYSISSFFTAFVVWAMLKWQAMEDESRANRWLIFIFYMMGLSIGVHLLNLVAVPALALIYYFKKYKPGTWGVVATLLTGLLIIFTIFELIIPGLPSVAGNFEIFFVNTLGLPFGSGASFFGIIILAMLIYGIYYTQQKRKPLLNTALLALSFILIGYSSYAMVVIRSNADTPINENEPSDVMRVVRYLKREQYGTRPLLYGQYFTAQMEGIEEGAPVYAKGKDKYEVVDHKLSVKYPAKDQTILPRIWSTEESHRKTYQDLLGLRAGEKPSFTDNLRFMFTHQIGWMYVRYFFFNFAGRESDDQNATWLSPRQWFEALPPSLAENRGRNNFFMIPFVLGLVGMYYQSVKNTKNFLAIALLFLLTGVALVIYLNSPPVEPRERDYIYVGSYYAYCFWIGFAVIALSEWLTKLFKSRRTAGIAATLICLSAPLLMVKDGWDDHNRAKRYFSVDTAINDLQSCAPDSILFTGGDNDTFPQWYVQDVEGVRTDVRVIVSSYFNSDWYVGQAMRQRYESKPFPFTLTRHNYREGGPNNPYLPYYDMKIPSMDLKDYLELLKKEHKALLVYPSANVVPTRDIVLKVDVEKVRSLGVVPKTLEHLIVPEIHLRLKENGLELKDLAMLDVLATADWQRPVYVTNTSLAQFNVDLTPYAVREGNTYRILPVLNSDPQNDLVNTEASYENMTKKFQFRGLNDPDIYFTDDYRRAVQNHRNNFNSLATALLMEGDTTKAKEVILFSLDKMPDRGVRYDITHLQTSQLLFELGEREKAVGIADTLAERADQLITYYLNTGQYGQKLQLQMAIVREVARIYYIYDEGDRARAVENIFNRHASIFGMKRREM